MKPRKPATHEEYRIVAPPGEVYVKEYRITAPIGTPLEVYVAAFKVGRTFADEHTDRQPWMAGAVVYASGPECRFIVYWTAARRVIVRVEIKDRTTS